jgi:segregation and condensation protein A
MASGYRPGSAVGLTAETAAHLELGAAYAVTLPGFEGPLDLLLHLIEQEQLDISEVSLVAVTDQYLRTIEQMERPAPGALADFLVVASRLLYLKSVRLLPKPPDSGDEEEDSGSALVRHLLEYRVFRRAADALRNRDETARVFPRPPATLVPAVMAERAPEFGELEAAMLRAALQKALARVAQVTPPPAVHPYPVTVAERMAEVRQRLRKQAAQGLPRLGFAALLSEVDTRIAVVVTFLAVLELVKQRELVATQEGTFGEIWLAWQEPDGEALSAAATDGQESAAEETGPDQAEDAEEP